MTVAEPDERWAELGRQACLALAPLFRTIEHVGSTAATGPAAQPVISLVASIDDLDDVDERALETFGYRTAPSEVRDRRFYRREDYDSTAYHLHVTVRNGG